MTLSTVYSALVIVTIISLRLVIMGLRAVLKRVPLSPKERGLIALLTAVGILLWLAFTGFLAARGFLIDWQAVPPRIPLIPLTALIILIGLSRTKVFKQLLLATPAYWIVGFQTFRIFVEFCFWGLYKAGGAPQLVTFEGRNFDILVGITAPFIAFAIYKMNLRPQLVILWNFIGLGILSNTIVTLLTAQPGPLHINWPGDPFIAFSTWPFIWIPAFLAPLAVFLHCISIWQNLILLRAKEPQS